MSLCQHLSLSLDRRKAGRDQWIPDLRDPIGLSGVCSWPTVQIPSSPLCDLISVENFDSAQPICEPSVQSERHLLHRLFVSTARTAYYYTDILLPFTPPTQSLGIPNGIPKNFLTDIFHFKSNI